ncbi:lipid A biosynthesis acyltransferase [Aliarcobacter skirrowii]|uniref:Lipid A biosynthesis acyltransferase n=2 Tax=Aliarcobacter skirrowii TaxID=28200 RepID=A0A2U2BYN0_9BACT|nr:lipid A biosynthesis acyltransferase [Aliarcobacter skirrowii]PWE19585.1 lipid A biosynthesis acyltransferase [Aliarcobacter skirrowii]PWE19810.1 lipid A biosynthesis acyltransferase [Aliarcobacter skirrowii]RJO55221.1 lipid A biosynthesis acyltransferase [Aliarcobacter skirrowii]RJO57259.1 lipid A biosynthesis acyltransferase [Aliarcobacter skirrowii]
MIEKIKDYFILILYYIFLFLFFITPKFLMEKFLKFLAFLAYKVDKKHLKIARANIDLVFKDSLTKSRKEEIIYNSYKSLCFNMYEHIENQRVNKEILFSKANILNKEIIEKAFKDNRKIIYITAHYGGWEITLPYVAMMFGEIAVVNRRMDNPHIQKKYEIGRSKNRITMLEKKSAAKGMLTAFKENKSIAVVIDQHIGSGIDIEFLGQKVKATDSTARVALKFDAIIIPIFTVNNGFRDWTIEVQEPIDVKTYDFKTEDKIKELTQIQNDIVSNQILKKPDFWLWQHKRFKAYNYEIYKK